MGGSLFYVRDVSEQSKKLWGVGGLWSSILRLRYDFFTPYAFSGLSPVNTILDFDAAYFLSLKEGLTPQVFWWKFPKSVELLFYFDLVVLSLFLLYWVKYSLIPLLKFGLDVIAPFFYLCCSSFNSYICFISYAACSNLDKCLLMEGFKSSSICVIYYWWVTLALSSFKCLVLNYDESCLGLWSSQELWWIFGFD